MRASSYNRGNLHSEAMERTYGVWAAGRLLA